MEKLTPKSRKITCPGDGSELFDGSKKHDFPGAKSGYTLKRPFIQGKNRPMREFSSVFDGGVGGGVIVGSWENADRGASEMFPLWPYTFLVKSINPAFNSVCTAKRVLFDLFIFVEVILNSL